MRNHRWEIISRFPPDKTHVVLLIGMNHIIYLILNCQRWAHRNSIRVMNWAHFKVMAYLNENISQKMAAPCKKIFTRLTLNNISFVLFPGKLHFRMEIVCSSAHRWERKKLSIFAAKVNLFHYWARKLPFCPLQCVFSGLSSVCNSSGIAGWWGKV